MARAALLRLCLPSSDQHKGGIWGGRIRLPPIVLRSIRKAAAMGPIVLLLLVGGGVVLAFSSSKKKPSSSSTTPGVPQAPGAPPLPGVPPQAFPPSPLGRRQGGQPAHPARAMLVKLRRAAAGLQLAPPARKEPASPSVKRRFLPVVGPACLDTINVLQAFGDATRAGIDGSWGDDTYRVAGFTHQLVAAALFPELWDLWNAKLAEGLAQTDPNSDFSADGHQHAVLWTGVRPVSWDEDPEKFASQIATVQQRVRSVVAAHQFNASAPAAGWNPAAATPEAASAELQTGMNKINEVAQEPVVKDLMESMGMSSGNYGIPIFGWALAIVDAIIQLAYAIFGTAEGVQNIFATPLAEGERAMWDGYMAGVIVMLRKLLDECKQLSGPIKLAPGLKATARVRAA